MTLIHKILLFAAVRIGSPQVIDCAQFPCPVLGGDMACDPAKLQCGIVFSQSYPSPLCGFTVNCNVKANQDCFAICNGHGSCPGNVGINTAFSSTRTAISYINCTEPFACGGSITINGQTSTAQPKAGAVTFDANSPSNTLYSVLKCPPNNAPCRAVCGQTCCADCTAINCQPGFEVTCRGGVSDCGCCGVNSQCSGLDLVSQQPTQSPITQSPTQSPTTSPTVSPSLPPAPAYMIPLCHRQRTFRDNVDGGASTVVFGETDIFVQNSVGSHYKELGNIRVIQGGCHKMMIICYPTDGIMAWSWAAADVNTIRVSFLVHNGTTVPNQHGYFYPANIVLGHTARFDSIGSKSTRLWSVGNQKGYLAAGEYDVSIWTDPYTGRRQYYVQAFLIQC